METTLSPSPGVSLVDDPFVDSTAMDGTPGESASRYGTLVRVMVAAGAGILAGVLLINSAEAGAAFAFGEVGDSGWTTIFWGEHWAWRTVWSLVATYLSGFLAGMIARQRGALVGGLVGAASVVLWGMVALVGWTGWLPAGAAPVEVPIGYRITASLLAVATLPVCIVGAHAGEPFGLANGSHFDSRRGTLLGVRWYHYLWLPFPIHTFTAMSTWAAMYSFGWLVAWWAAGWSLLAFIPGLVFIAMLWTFQLSGTGAFRAYEALAGFDDEAPIQARTWRRVLKFGIGFPLAACALQLAIAGIQIGLSRLVSH